MDEREEIEKFEREVNANPLLRKYHRKIVNGRTHFLLRILGIIFTITSISCLFLLIYDGKFQSDIHCNQNVSCPSIPNINIPSCPIIPKCPDYPSCDFTFPKNIDIIITNKT